jgi:Ca2+-transporting ATPase
MSSESGLTTSEAQARLARVGANALPEPPRDPLWRRFVRQFRSPLIYILLFALAFDVGLWAYEGAQSWPVEATAIGLILLFNAGLGLYQERRSEAALARLEALAGAQAWVFRDGRVARIPIEDIVPGDRVRLEAGDRVPADGALQQPHGAMLDESMLTGESVPIDAEAGAPLYAGSLIRRGQAVAEVIATGSRTYFGRTAELVRVARAASTEQGPSLGRCGTSPR